MNEQLEQLIATVKHAADLQVKSINDLSQAVEAGNKQELVMDGIDLLLDRERKGQNKKELDDVEDRISETNNILQNIQDGLAAWSQSWTDLFSSLKQTADDQLRIANQQLRLEDQSRVADEEARREAARADEASPNALIFQDALQQGKNERDEMPGFKMGGGSLFSMFSAIAAVGAVAKLFDVDEFMRIPAYLVTFSKQISVLAKGFGTMIASLGKVGTFLSSIGSSVATFLKTSSTIAKILGPIGTVLGKLALPITVIMGILDGIGGFMKGYADTGSILTGIREAFVGIIDGLVGTLVRFAGEIIAFIPDIIGLDAVAETITDLFGGVVDGFMNMFRGVFDTVMGILTLDFGRLTDGLGNLLFGFVDTIQELLFAPFNMAINFFRDIFGFSEEDAPPFRVQDVILDTINSIADWFTNLFDFDLPSFEDIRRNFLPSWLGGGPNQEELQAELDEATMVDEKLKSAMSVDANFDPNNPVLRPSENGLETYVGGLASVGRSFYDQESNQILSDRLITNQGMELATPERRAELEKQSGARVAAAQAALDSYTPFNPLGEIGNAVSAFGGQAMDLGRQGLDYAGEKASAAVDVVGDAFDTASEVVGSVVSDAITAVKDKAEALFDPIKNAFNSMIDTVKGIFDLGKIRDMLTNMFAEVGVPRVEFDVPVIGKVGFGPFYPFAPGGAVVSQIDTGTSVETKSTDGPEPGRSDDTFEQTFKSRTTSIESMNATEEEIRAAFPGASEEHIQALVKQEQEVSRGTRALAEESITSQDGDLQTQTNKQAFASFDYETGKGSVDISTYGRLENLATDESRELEDTVKRYEVGPMVMSKVRRMIDAGATPSQVEEFLIENEKTIADKVGGFLDSIGVGGLVDNVKENLEINSLREKAITGDLSLEEFSKLRDTGQLFTDEAINEETAKAAQAAAMYGEDYYREKDAIIQKYDNINDPELMKEMEAFDEANAHLGPFAGKKYEDIKNEDGSFTDFGREQMRAMAKQGLMFGSLDAVAHGTGKQKVEQMDGVLAEVDNALKAITGEEITVQGETFKMDDTVRGNLEQYRDRVQSGRDFFADIVGPSDEEAYAAYQDAASILNSEEIRERTFLEKSGIKGKIDSAVVQAKDTAGGILEDVEDYGIIGSNIPDFVKNPMEEAGYLLDDAKDAVSPMLDQGIAAISGFFSGRDSGDVSDMIEPTPSRALNAPVGQASQEVAAEKSSTNVIAPVSNSNANINNSVNNNYNTNTIAPSAGPRSSDPTFQRVQNNNFNGL